MTREKLSSDKTLLSLIQEAELSCLKSNYSKAETLYSNAIELDRSNAVLLGNRSMTRFYLQKYESALTDAQLSVQVDAGYAKGYYRLGNAYQSLNQHNNALVAFAKGMSIDSKNFAFLQALIDTALKSPLQASLKPVMAQLKEINLDTNPFVVISVIGQDLLAHNHAKEAVEVLECAVVIDTSSLKLKGSVYSALSSALWMLDDYKRAIFYMGEDLKVSQDLCDTPGECRAYGNLGAAYFHQNKFDLALENHNHQLQIAKKLQHKQLIASAHSGLGSVYGAQGLHQLAVEQHRMAATLYGHLHDSLTKSRELGKISLSLFALGDLDSALVAQEDRIRLYSSGNQTDDEEQALVYTEIAASYKALEKPSEEITCLQKSADIFSNLGDVTNEVKVLLSLGYSARSSGDWSTAITTYERLLEISLKTTDEGLEARSCANLGIVHHQVGQFQLALKFQTRALHLSSKLGDIGSQGKAYGNIGNAYSASGLYEQALTYHLKELEISRSISDKESECSTHGNLAVAYQALTMHDEALMHYKCQYELAKEIGKASIEARSLMNLANFHNTMSQFEEAITYYNDYLALPSTPAHASGHSRALYNLGFAHFSLQNFEQAVESYEKSIAVGTSSQDKVAIARAYCNLGLAKKALGDYESATQCQEMFLTMSSELNSSRGKLKAYGNLGDICTAKKDFEQAVSCYEQQLVLAEEFEDKLVIAQSCCSLGVALRAINSVEKAAEYHKKECLIYSELDDPKSEYKAQGRQGATLTELGLYAEASSCYDRQLELSDDHLTQAQAWGNLAITCVNLRDYDRAKSSYESQIDVLDQLESKSSRLERCRAYCGVANCCEALDDLQGVINFSQVALTLASELKNLALMEKACQSLSNALYLVNNHDCAITFSKHRLNICKMMGRTTTVASAYGDLGFLYSMNEHYEDALQCFSQQMKIAVEANDDVMKGDAACGMGSVYLLVKDQEKALTFHKLDLELAQRNDDRPWRGRAYGNIAATHEAMEDFASAIPFREQHLFIAKEENDELARLVALHGIGRNTLRVQNGDFSRAMLLLQQAMLLSHGIKKNEQMVSTIYDLGIATWACGDFPAATAHLTKAMEIAESLCCNAYSSIKTGVASVTTLKESYKLVCKSSSALMCLMSCSGQGREALDVAERCRTFLHRLFQTSGHQKLLQAASTNQISDYTKRHNCGLIYFTITAGTLLRWFVSSSGLVHFVGYTFIRDKAGDSVIDHLLSSLHGALGVSRDDDNEYDELKVNDNDNVKKETPYLQLLSIYRSFKLDCSHITTSRGRLFPPENEEINLTSKPPFFILHDLFLSQLDKELKQSLANKVSKLVLVLDEDLHFVPFPMLKKRTIDRYFGDSFVINVSSSFQSLIASCGGSLSNRCLTYADPMLSEDAESESCFTADLFGVESLVGVRNVKEKILNDFESSEIVHFACPVSLSNHCGVVLQKGEVMLDDDASLSGSSSASDDVCEKEQGADVVLSMSDLLNLNLTSTKLVILGAPYLSTSSSHFAKTSKTFQNLSNYVHCLLLQGVKSVLLPLWPIPESASSLLLRDFFKRLKEGSSTCDAFAAAMKMLRADKRFEHPSYWSGFVLIGQDIHISSHDLSMTYALNKLLPNEPSMSRDTITLLLHLIDKSLRLELNHGAGVPMYTSQESVSTRVGSVCEWRPLFSAAGFQLKSHHGEISDAVFFPTNHEEELKIVIEKLNPFLSVSDQTLQCFGKLVSSPSTSALLLRWLDGIAERVSRNEAVWRPQAEACNERFVMDKSMWQIDGVSELLLCSGLEVIEDTDNSVALQISSSFNLKSVKLALHCLHVLFGHIDNLNIPDQQIITETSSSVVSNDLIKRSFATSLIVSGITSAVADDPADFSTSFNSGRSTNESYRLRSSTSDQNNAEFGVMSFEEPKNFTQTPKSSDLIAPKPVLLQKSPFSTPVNVPSPGGGFSPSKKFQFASSLEKLVHSPSASFLHLAEQTSPTQARFSGLTPRHPSSSDHVSPSDGSLLNGVQVCVVSPQRENQRSKETSRSQDRYLSLINDSSVETDDDQKNMADGRTKSVNSVNSSRDEFYSNGGRPNSVSRSSSGSYKPSPSAASVLRTTPPQYEYTGIVDKLNRISSGSPEIRSKVTTTHTAFRLVNQSATFSQPKIQKYLVETNISTVSTLISEDGELPPSGSDDSHSRAEKVKRENSQASFFDRLGSIKIQDDRVQFV